MDSEDEIETAFQDSKEDLETAFQDSKEDLETHMNNLEISDKNTANYDYVSDTTKNDNITNDIFNKDNVLDNSDKKNNIATNNIKKDNVKKVANIKQFDIIVYHGNCPDGITALAIAKLQQINKNAMQIPCSAGKFPKGNFVDKTILFLDICPIKPMLESLSKIAKQIVILDHHKTTEESMVIYKNGNVIIIYDKEKSGCQITWDYFAENKPYPWIVNYVSDKDLGRWKLPFSREINYCLVDDNYIDDKNLTKIYELMICYDENNLDCFIEKGKEYVKYYDKIIETHYHQASESQFIGNYNIWLVECSMKCINTELGVKLAKKKFKNGNYPDFVAIYSYKHENNKFVFSVRADENSNIDLAEISKQFEEGGGHLLASGFKITGSEKLQNVTYLLSQGK